VRVTPFHTMETGHVGAVDVFRVEELKLNAGVWLIFSFPCDPFILSAPACHQVTVDYILPTSIGRRSCRIFPLS
jgi:hypothetical protein